MNTAFRLAGIVAALGLVFGAAWGIGVAASAPGPVVAAQPATPPLSAGLVAAAAGYALAPQGVTTFTPGVPGELVFLVTGPDGSQVTSVAEPTEAVVVRRDGAGLARLHPVQRPDGAWAAPVQLPAPGVYRVFVDVVPAGGPPLVLGADLFAPGEFQPLGFGPSRVAQVAGYQVRLDGDIVAGTRSQVFASISKDGAAVTDLEPVDGVFARLVALRQSDLAYVRGEGPPAGAARTAGPALTLTVDVPSAGTYRIFVEFRHAGAVQGVEFTVPAR